MLLQKLEKQKTWLIRSSFFAQSKACGLKNQNLSFFKTKLANQYIKPLCFSGQKSEIKK